VHCHCATRLLRGEDVGDDEPAGQERRANLQVESNAGFAGKNHRRITHQADRV
jgi:hypothetical protein